MSLEKVLEEIAGYMKTISEKIGTAPVVKRRATKKKDDQVAAAAVIDTLAEVGDSTGVEEVKVFTEEDLRNAAGPLVKVSGEGNKDGYNAAQKIILNYAESLADVPEAKRGEVIAELEAAFKNWGGGLGGL